VPDLDHQQAARVQMPRRLLQDDAHRIQPVFAAGQRDFRLTPVFLGQPAHDRRPDIRRIGHDQVVVFSAKRGKQIGLDKADPPAQAILPHVDPGNGQRSGCNIGGVDPGAGKAVREQDGKTP